MQRGLDEQHELPPQMLLRDTRTTGMRIVDFFKDPVNSACLIAGIGVTAFFFSALSEFIGIIGILTFLYAYTRESKLPFRMPQRSGALDYNDPLPGIKPKPRKARGIAFFGNRKSTNEELWFNNDDMRTHVLIFGSTGSGKTEALVSLAFNALVQGSGFLYVDGKGDNSLFAKVFSMCRFMGREDDLLLINFMTGARDIIGAQEKRLSNTMNPFCNGSSGMLSNLVISLMDSGGQSSDGDMWKGRATSFVEALMRVLVYMRDQGKILLDANSIRGYFDLTRLEAIALDKMFIRDKQEPVSLADAPDIVLEPISNYLATLPGFDRTKKGKQSSTVFEQHGFITMQLTKVFGSLADTYGHIIRTNLSEVDLKDVVLNRRILVVLLPALEKSPDELSNLGKVIIASLKAMMAAGLGDSVEGTYKEVITRKPTNAATPYMCILDEYGYYAVKGFAVVPAQARSLGFSVIFAGQDLPAKSI
jgi:intracellular multiplication protein IcmO